MIILGVETSCDETSVALVKDERQILSNIVFSQIEEHTKYGGIVPEIASRRHLEHISQVTSLALKESGATPDQVDAVAVTNTPGLVGALLVGTNFAKSLSYAISKPLISVHHLKGHIASLYLTYPELYPPFIALVVSGAHSHLIHVKDYTDFIVLGRSVDDAAGEAFDKVARALGLGYPGGPAISEISKEGNELRYSLPTPHTENPFDVSFSGLKTAVINILNQKRMQEEELSRADMAASFQKVATDMLTAHLIDAALEHKLDVALCGGVAANSMLRMKISDSAKEHNIKAYFASPVLCGDNAAMIAAAGFYEYTNGNFSGIDLNAYATMSL